MLKFKQIEIEDINLLSNYLDENTYQICDYSPVTIFMWKDYFKTKYCILNGFIIIKNIINEKEYFQFPIGKGNYDEVFKAINEYCLDKGIPVNFHCLTERMLDILNKYYPSFQYTYDRDWSDYMYEHNALVSLSGKKLATQRNHLNKFIKTYDYEYEEINEENIYFIKDFVKQINVNKDDALETQEMQGLNLLLDNYFKFNVIGGMILVDNKVVSFSIGKKIDDVLLVHIEKGTKEINGSYQVIFNELLKHHKAKFVNREEDLGDQGLRYSKLNYRPLALINKYYTSN